MTKEIEKRILDLSEGFFSGCNILENRFRDRYYIELFKNKKPYRLLVAYIDDYQSGTPLERMIGKACLECYERRGEGLSEEYRKKRPDTEFEKLLKKIGDTLTGNVSV